MRPVDPPPYWYGPLQSETAYLVFGKYKAIGGLHTSRPQGLDPGRYFWLWTFVSFLSSDCIHLPMQALSYRSECFFLRSLKWIAENTHPSSCTLHYFELVFTAIFSSHSLFSQTTHGMIELCLPSLWQVCRHRTVWVLKRGTYTQLLADLGEVLCPTPKAVL